MFPQHATLHPSIVGYQDGVEFVAGASPATPSSRLVLSGWAFHWREAARPVRYVCQLDDSVYHHQELTLIDRPDVSDAYSRVAVRKCGWGQTIVLQTTMDPEDCPPQWLEMQLRSGEWVKFRDLVKYEDEEDDEDDVDQTTAAAAAPIASAAAAAPLLAEEVVVLEKATTEMVAITTRVDDITAKVVAIQAQINELTERVDALFGTRCSSSSRCE